MKLLVFAHTPPPHHGQSYMVKLMLDGFGGDRRKSKIEVRRSETGEATKSNPDLRSPISDLPPPIECYHVNCRYSDSLEDIGSFRLHKMLLVLRYCLEAIWCRFRYGVRSFYYVPAPGKRAALYRDWIVMLLCRPFFPTVILHWHAVGLGDWLQKEASWLERWITHRLLGRPALGIALAITNMRDPLWFRVHQAVDVPNGIPDPCPEFEKNIRPNRLARHAARVRLLTAPATAAGASEIEMQFCNVLFLAHCTPDKGLFDTVDGVIAANEELRAKGVALRFRLTVAGAFVDPRSEQEFGSRLARFPGTIHYAGFVAEAAKAKLLEEADVFCFPTYYAAEGQPVNLIEAISFGLPVVTTRWRAIPEILAADYRGFVPPKSPGAVATALIAAAAEDGAHSRALYLSRYTIDSYLRQLAETIRGAEGQAGGRLNARPRLL